jgi:hypothetical protein
MMTHQHEEHELLSQDWKVEIEKRIRDIERTLAIVMAEHYPGGVESTVAFLSCLRQFDNAETPTSNDHKNDPQG